MILFQLHRISHICLLAVLCSIIVPYAAAQDGSKTLPDTQISLNGDVELARLVDLCANRLHLNIDYDAAQLRGNVTLRLGSGALTDDELWALTNRILASRGFTSIRLPGDAGEHVLSIVRVNEAAGLAAIEQRDTRSTYSGFSTVVLRIKHRSVERILEAIRPSLSKPGGTITSLGDDGLILLSDLRPRIDQIVTLVALLDIPVQSAIIERVPVKYYTATRLATTIASIVAAQQLVDETGILGRVIPEPGDCALLIIAPEDEITYWKDLIKQFDLEAPTETRTYTPSYFGVDAVANLIEQLIRPTGRYTTVENQLHLVRDDLTGTLIITATVEQHDRISAFIKRLNSTSVEGRRSFRSYPIRNRPVSEIIEILDQLVAAGIFDSGNTFQTVRPSATDDATATKSNEASELQTSAIGIESTQSPDTDTPRSTSYSSSPSLHLTADEATNTLIAVGESKLLGQLEKLIYTLDIRQAQVMIEVLLVSLSEGQTMDLGVELEKFELSGDTLFSLSSLFGLSSSDAAGSRTVEDGRGGTAVILNPGDFSIVLRALETLNEGQTLSIPQVLVNDNELASLNAVLQEPFLSTNASDTVATTSFGGTSNAGTSVQITPHIAGGDHLVVDYSISLSSFVGESSDPSLPPPRQENSLQSVATVPDGYVVALGGLDTTSTAEAASQVPFLGGIPLLGELFKNRSQFESQSRFFVFIRPTILRDLNFEALKYLSDQEVNKSDIDDGWPEVEPRIIW